MLQGGNQYWMLSKQGEVRRDDACLDFTGREVVLFSCHGGGGNQDWSYNHDSSSLKHSVSKKCLTLSEKRDQLLMQACEQDNQRQRWKFQNYNASLALS